jgi:hypothetical protein
MHGNDLNGTAGNLRWNPQPDSGNRAWRKKQLDKIVRRIQENAVGRADYSTGDFVEDVKRACARETVPFDNDIFNELVPVN